MANRHPLLDEDLRKTNFADTPKVAKAVEDHFSGLIKEVRNGRKTLEQDWLDYYNIWLTNPTNRYYVGRANIFIGVVRKSIERWTGRICRSLFPSDELFTVTADASHEDAAAQAEYAVEDYVLNRVIRLKRLMKPHIRALLIFGTSPLKTFYKKDYQYVIHKQKTMHDNMESIETICERVLAYDGPAAVNVPLFNFYVWPETSDDLSQATIVFQDVLISAQTYRHKQKSGWYSMKVTPEKASPAATDQFYVQTQIMANLGISDLRKYTMKEDFYAVTELWGWWDLLDIGEPQRCVFSFNNDTKCVQARVHPYWKQDVPYFCSRLGVVPGEFYGHGFVEPVKEQSYELNDRSNQNLDNTSIINNPVITVDDDEGVDLRELQFSPGAKWAIKPDSVRQLVIQDTTQAGYAAIQQIYGMIREQTDPGPMSLPRSVKAVRAASTMSQAAIEADMEVLEIAREVEEDVLEPMLSYHHAMREQYMENDVILRIAGPKGHGVTERIVRPEDILGNFKYRWLGSLSAMNLHVRVQAMMMGINVFAKIPLSDGMKINWNYLIKKYWRDGLGFKDDDQLVIDVNDIPSIDPEIENETARKGIDALRVSPKDDDRAHLSSHDVALPTMEGDAQRIMKLHMDDHIYAMKLKKAQKAQAQQQQLMRAMGAGQQPAPEPKRRGKDKGERQVPTTMDPSQILRGIMS